MRGTCLPCVVLVCLVCFAWYLFALRLGAWYLFALIEIKRRGRRRQKGSATVLNKVNSRFEKRFSNSNFVQGIDRGVEFFEAWVSVFDEVLNWNSRKSILELARLPQFA